MSGWQPIETAPRNEPVLVHWDEAQGFNGSTETAVLSEWCDPDTGAIEEVCWGSTCELHPEWHDEDPTHWQPLPEPPQAPTENETV